MTTQTYYELLGVSPQADAATIRQAFQARYTEWMPLVNHHQPEQALRAQQMLRLLEEARDTLLDPARRQAYDAQLGTVGGVIDPTATPTTATPPGMMPPPPPPPPPPPFRPSSRKSLWECPKCGVENPQFQEFCLNCGQRLLEVCPVCEEKTFLVATQRCGSCGRSARECEAWWNQTHTLEQRIDELRATAQRYEAMVKANAAGEGEGEGCSPGCFTTMIVVLVGIGFWSGFRDGFGGAFGLLLFYSFPVLLGILLLFWFRAVRYTSIEHAKAQRCAYWQAQLKSVQQELSNWEQQLRHHLNSRRPG